MVRLDTSGARPATSMFLAVVGEVLLGTLVSKACVASESRSLANASMDDSTDMAPPPDEMELGIRSLRDGCFVENAEEQFLEVAEMVCLHSLQMVDSIHCRREDRVIPPFDGRSYWRRWTET